MAKKKSMEKNRKKPNPLVSALERALDLGEFISYGRSWNFVQGLEDVKPKIDALVKDGNAERAVGLSEIFLKKGKSQYYQYALENFRKAGKLYGKAGRNQLWMDLVERVRREHFRKYSFMPDFEKIAAGHPLKKPQSFETRALKRWKKQIS